MPYLFLIKSPYDLFYGGLLKYVEGAHTPNTDNVGLYDLTEKRK